MNQEKKNKSSHLRDLSESVSTNLSLSVSPCLQSASESLSCLKMLPFYISGSGPINGPKFKSILTLPFETEDHATPRRRRLRRNVPEASEISLAGSLQRRASMLLQSATPQRGVPRSCVPEAPATLLIVFSAFDLFFYYSASFFTPISPCPVKHCSMGD